MRIFEAVGATIRRYGSSVEVSRDGERVSSKAFVQPLRYKNKVYIGGKYHMLGYYKNERYLFVGTPNIKLTANRSIVKANGESYVVKRCETYYVTDVAVYVWAILQPYGQELEDDYDTD